MRPSFHFTAESGWINDPHGITVRDGEYHLFYQYVPESTVWAPNCHWGHARGADLFTLEHLPVALAPGDGDGGIWTGSLVTDDEGATRIFYTSTSQPDLGTGRIRVATPEDDNWISWRKGGFVADVPDGLGITSYRDPFLVREGEGWRMFVGAGAEDGTAMAVTYRSADLDAWEFDGVTLERPTEEREPVWMGALWECPQIFEVDGRAVMVSSVWDADTLHYAGYAVGEYEDGRFRAQSWGRLTFGPSYYAPSFFRDAAGRPCLTFWMRGVADFEASWASAHSVPHVLHLEGDNLVAVPHPDLLTYHGPRVAAGQLPGLAADITWEPSDGAGALTLDTGGEPVAHLGLRDGTLTVAAGGEEWKIPSAGTIRIVLDAQVMEVSTTGGLFGVTLQPDGAAYRVQGDGPLAVSPLVRS
ncbi:glycoside hydrolase family 32 protein [Leifsonia sp. 2MCAF36]|uniref:glycoside hydrolase family 32 protein n=1 Tax=Leifsonia sp. 2MCAF36 TaxID=3232988 RepID=UPI003F94F9D4